MRRPGRDGEAGAISDGGRDVKGLVCVLPNGHLVMGEDTGQPVIRPGFGIFTPDGEQIGKPAPTGFRPQPEPFGCAVDAQGRLFTTEIGDPFQSNGQLMVWFPPYEGFPGAPGTYPNPDASTNYCKLAIDIGAASGIALDDEGRIVKESFIQHGTIATPSGIARGPNGNWFVSSVLTSRIAEFSPAGLFVRSILSPPEGPVTELPASTGHPQSLAFDAQGRLYYADLNLIGSQLCVPGTRGCGACQNGVDDDDDGLVDQEGGDPDCTSADDPSENESSFACDDGADNDGDAHWLDAKCRSDWPYWEITPACGIGAELALLLPLGAAWRRRAYFSSKSAR